MSSVFHLFPNLPSELRLKIYEETFPTAQIIPVRFSRPQNQYTTLNPPHPLLSVSKESRDCYLSTHTNLILNPRYTSTVFINFALDTIFFDNIECSPAGDLAWDLASSPHKDRILRCAIDAQLWEILRVFRYEGLSEVKMLGNLKVVALVMKREERKRPDWGIEGHEIVDRVNTVQEEIAMANGYVEVLRGEIAMGGVKMWEEKGEKPNVQLWLW